MNPGRSTAALAKIQGTQTRPSGRLMDAIGIQKASGGSLFAWGALHELQQVQHMDLLRFRLSRQSHMLRPRKHTKPVLSAYATCALSTGKR